VILNRFLECVNQRKNSIFVLFFKFNTVVTGLVGVGVRYKKQVAVLFVQMITSYCSSFLIERILK